MKSKLLIGCHVSVAGEVYNAPKNAADLGCETFQIFTRPPMGGKAPELTPEIIEKFRTQMQSYGYSYRYGSDGNPFVVHTPYFINFGSGNPRIYHGSINIVKQELERASLLGAKYVMAHLGSGKDLGLKKAIKQTQEGLKEVLDGYKGLTKFLIEIAAGSGEILGDTFEEIAEVMEPLKKYSGFGGVCFDTQHAWASGYDLNKPEEVFKKFNQIIGLKWLKMSHVNDSKVELGSHKDRHEHIGEGKIGKSGFKEFLRYLNNLSVPLKAGHLPLKGENNNIAFGANNLSAPRKTRGISPSIGENYNVAFGSMPLILETEHDKVKADIKALKTLRNKLK